MHPSDIHLVLFLSRATPLQRWDKMGILEREIAIYKELSQRLGKISIVSSGDSRELAYQEMLGNIQVLYNRWRLSPNAYSIFAPLLHWSSLHNATIYKTNQPDGAWTAVIAGIIYNKPVIARAGYLWADLYKQERGRNLRSILIDLLQSFSFTRARAIVLTTEVMKQHFIHAYHISPERITVIPNNVNTDIFIPMPDVVRIRHRICFIGRLHPIKNLHLVIKAISGIPDVSLVIIGQGEQHDQLGALSRAIMVNVNFLGTIPNDQIPLELNRSELFILPSTVEGHPKALIEAMACGIAVIGADSPGIREIIQHGKTGWLCKTDVESLQQGIRFLLDHPDLRIDLGMNARRYVLEHFSLDRIVDMEYSFITGIVNSR